jgi:hypothetical protein
MATACRFRNFRIGRREGRAEVDPGARKPACPIISEEREDVTLAALS